MAGDWIAMRHDLAEDPAVMDMALILGCDELVVVGRLYAVWRWFDEQTTDGHAVSVTGVTLDRRVDRFARHEGFATAMRKVGWLDDNGLPRFDTWMSKSAKTRLLAARRKRAERSRSERDKNATRGEERRGEKNKKKESSLRELKKEAPAPRWRRFPEVEMTQDRLDYALSVGLSPEEARREWEQIRDFEFRDPKTDPAATWRRWCRTAAERRTAVNGVRQKSLADMAAEMDREEQARQARRSQA